jgi:hypothetical protein
MRRCESPDYLFNANIFRNRTMDFSLDATPDGRRELIFTSSKVVLSAESYLTHILNPFLEQLTISLALYQPERPTAFTKAFAEGKAFEGNVRGGDQFDEASAKSYMTVLGGPLIQEIMSALLAAPSEKRPSSKNALDAWIVENIDSLGAKVDAASMKISASLRGVAARKKVNMMKNDPEVQARKEKAANSGAYAKGGVSGKQLKRMASSRGPAGGVDDSNQSTVGRGKEEQVTVNNADFEAYLRDEAIKAGRVVAEVSLDTSSSGDGEQSATLSSSADGHAGSSPTGGSDENAPTAGVVGSGMSRQQAEEKIGTVSRGMIARRKTKAMKNDPIYQNKIAEIKKSDAYSGGLTGKQKKKLEAAEAARKAAAEAGTAVEGEDGDEKDNEPGQMSAPGDSVLSALLNKDVEVVMMDNLNEKEAAAKKFETLAVGKITRKRTNKLKENPDVLERAAKAKASDAYSGGLTGKQKKKLEQQLAAEAAREAASATTENVVDVDVVAEPTANDE